MTMVNLKAVTEGKWSVEEAVEMLNAGKIDTNITIQRSEKWKQGQKETLIDSMLEGMPRIPQIQLNRVSKTDTHEALDGKQRLTTLRDILGDVFVVERDEPFNFRGKKYDLKGKRFSEFPQEIKQQISLYPLNFIIYTDLTETEKRICFYRTNLGTPLSKTEHYRAICKCLSEIDEISKNPLFDDISSIAAKEEVIVKTEIMMGENPHLGNDKETYLTWATITFPKEKMDKYTKLYDKVDEIYQFYSTYCPDRVEYLCEKTGIEKNKRNSKKNTLIKKPLKKTHLLTLIPIVAKNMDYDSKLFGLWLTKFFVDSLDTTSESYIYNESCSGGSGNSVKTKARLTEMEASFEKFKKNPLTVEEVVGVLPKKEEKKEEKKEDKKDTGKDKKKTEQPKTTKKSTSSKKKETVTKDSKQKAEEVKKDKVVEDKKVDENGTKDKKTEDKKPSDKKVEDKKVEVKEEKKTEDKSKLENKKQTPKTEKKESEIKKETTENKKDKLEDKKVIELDKEKLETPKDIKTTEIPKKEQ